MKSVVVYESVYGNTHLVADAIGRGLAGAGEVVVVPVAEAPPALVADADVLVVGGPTHAHGMSRPSTGKDNHLEPGEEERAEEWGARLAAAVYLP